MLIPLLFHARPCSMGIFHIVAGHRTISYPIYFREPIAKLPIILTFQLFRYRATNLRREILRRSFDDMLNRVHWYPFITKTVVSVVCDHYLVFWHPISPVVTQGPHEEIPLSRFEQSHPH